MICERIALGNSLRRSCLDEDMPALSTVFKWLRTHDAFVEQYTRATKERAETFVDDMSDIADDPSLDPQDKRVRVDTRKWIASKLHPKYADKVAVTGDAGGPLVVSWLEPSK